MITYNDTTTKQGLYQHLKFITGQDSLGIEDATRLFNFAADRYSYLALTSSGRWNFDDTNHVDGDGDKTFNIATATLNSGETAIPLETSFLTINQVSVVNDNGKKVVLRPIDTRDDKSDVLRETYSVAGTPEKYDYNAHSLFIYPASGTSRTIEVQYGRAMKHFSTSDTSVSPGIPSIHYEYLVLYAAEQLSTRTQDNAYTQFRDARMRMEAEIRDWYSRRDQDSPRRLKPLMPNIGGSRRGRKINNISGIA